MQAPNYPNIILEDNKPDINSVNRERLNSLGETDLIMSLKMNQTPWPLSLQSCTEGQNLSAAAVKICAGPSLGIPEHIPPPAHHCRGAQTLPQLALGSVGFSCGWIKHSYLGADSGDFPGHINLSFVHGGCWKTLRMWRWQASLVFN